MKESEAVELTMTKYPKARRVAVVNTSMWGKDNGMANAMNLEQDRRLYQWDTTTVKAIKYCWTLLGIPH